MVRRTSPTRPDQPRSAAPPSTPTVGKLGEVAATWLDVHALRPWDRNPRHNAEAVAAVAKSIAAFGFGSPLVVQAETMRVIAGHTRLLAAKQLDLQRVPVRLLDVDDARATALALADNRTGELATWDDEALADVLRELGETDAALLDGIGWNEDELRDLLADKADEPPPPDTYTRKISIPIYEPTGPRPPVAELLDETRTSLLLADIAEADLPDEVRAFLQSAAQRHTRFNFGSIAEYYAHASAPVQRLFEDSALVIVDYDRAVELGLVRLSDTLRSLVGDSEVDDAA